MEKLLNLLEMGWQVEIIYRGDYKEYAVTLRKVYSRPKFRVGKDLEKVLASLWEELNE